MSNKTVAERRKIWEKATLQPVLDKFPERKEEFRNTSNVVIEPVYVPEDRDFDQEIGFPGEYPFTRGIYPTMHRGRLWTMRQYAGFATAEETNQRFRYLLDQGQTGLSVAFDLPTQMGYDSDHPLCLGEVGKVGVAIDSLKDMEILFDQIRLDKVSTSMTINAPAAILLVMYMAVAEKQGVPLSKISGTIQNDILKEYVARGTYIFPPAPSMRLICDIFRYSSEHLPIFNTISISGYHMREAGASAVQELAFTLSNAISYVDAAIKTGMDVDDFAKNLSFFFGVHNDVFEEIAKFRAARRLWARIMQERYGAKNTLSKTLRFHTQTCGSTLTAQQPDNNIVRVTLQALAAVLGGTQSLHTNSFDEALQLPTEESVMIALRTQQIIANESGAADTPDPLGGSYYIESLTDRIEAMAEEYIKRIDDMGGAVKAIENGYMSTEISNSSYQYQRQIEKGARKIVGVNCFRKHEPPFDSSAVSDKGEEIQVSKLKSLKNTRDQALVQETLAILGEKSASDENLVPCLLDCVKAYATLGEICDVLRKNFGEYSPGFNNY